MTLPHSLILNPRIIERFQNERDIPEETALSSEIMNEEDIFTEDLVRNWYWEIMFKMLNVHLIGLSLLGCFVYHISLAFAIIYLIVYDTINILLSLKKYKLENKLFR